MVGQDNGEEIAPVPAAIAIEPVVVSLEADLMVATRLEDVIRASGGAAVTLADPADLVTAVDRHFPVLALVDLATPGDWAGAIARCKLRPHTKQVPIYAFGSHVDTTTLQAARRAGADHAWARSRMMSELVMLVDAHINPPITYLDGWDDQLSPQARLGVAEFNRGDYFEQHEHFEAAWVAETRPIRALYQGILQVGLAFLQIERNNWDGALKMFRRGLPKLRTLPAQCQGIELAPLRAAAVAIHAEITALGPQRLHEFDQRRFPQIQAAASQAHNAQKRIHEDTQRHTKGSL
jgi:predicted metal-dependent hydrolase